MFGRNVLESTQVELDSPVSAYVTMYIQIEKSSGYK